MNLKRGEREQRPSPRIGPLWEVVVRGHKLFFRVCEYADGRPCEIWCDIANEGQLLQTSMHAFAKTFSLAIQHGTPLAELVDTFRHSQSEPCGPVVGDKEIKSCASLFDYIAHRLELSYVQGGAALSPAPEPSVNGRRADPPPPEKVAGHIGKGSGA